MNYSTGHKKIEPLKLISAKELMEKYCCKTCKYHSHEDITDGWVCVNQRSFYCTEWTEFDDYCEAWEVRERSRKNARIAEAKEYGNVLR